MTQETVDVSASGGLRARILAVDGWPLPDAVVTVTDMSGNQVARVVPDTGGVVTTAALPAGTYTVVVTAPGHQPLARSARVGRDGAGTLGDIVILADAESLALPTPGVWTIDPMHSTVVATARHLGIAGIAGRFSDVTGRIVVAERIAESSVQAEIKAAGIDTGLAMRDEHLRSPEFLDVDTYPVITFESTGLSRRSANTWSMAGTLSLHGERREVELDMTYGGCGADPWGGVRAAFHAETQLHRNDFAINYSAMVRAGVAAIGATVKIELDIEALQGGLRAGE